MTPGDAMPDIDDAAIALREKVGRDVWRIAAAITVTIPLWLGACSPVQHPAPPAAADTGPPTIVEPPPGPIALAPSITGTPAPLPAPAPAVAMLAPPPLAPVAAVALPPPAPTVAMPAPPPAPAPAVETAATAPSPCPPGATPVMSKPDMAGIPVLLCRRAQPTR